MRERDGIAAGDLTRALTKFEIRECVFRIPSHDLASGDFSFWLFLHDRHLMPAAKGGQLPAGAAGWPIDGLVRPV